MEIDAKIINGVNKSNGNVESSSNPMVYSIPGILHYIQHEWARFEIERAHWEVERAELQARIAFLQGERKGQENLKRDLIRRIKMLEFALRKERQKFHKLKYGTELKLPDIKDDEDHDLANNEIISNKNHDLVFNYKQGRQLLRQYLQEIGFTDKVLEMRSARIRSLLGITTDDLPTEDASTKSKKNEKRQEDFTVSLNQEQNCFDNPVDTDSTEVIEDSVTKNSLESKKVEHETGDTFVLKDFDFLGNEELNVDEASNIQNEEQDDWSNVDSEKLQNKIKQFKNETKDRGKKKRPNKDVMKNMLQTFNAGEEEILPPPPQASTPSVPRVSGGVVDDEIPVIGDTVLPSSGYSPRQVKLVAVNHSGVSDVTEVAMGLGDLADLSVSNELGNLDSKDDMRKTWGPKYTLRSHFDGVRSLCFHPYEAALITGSEDHTLKLWSLQKNVQGKRGNISDLEPVYTFRGHSDGVLCCAINSNGTVCYSGGLDFKIQCWNLPSLNIDLFGPYDPNVLGDALIGHSDSVWDLAYHIDTDFLLSCSADGTCKLWNPSIKSPLLETYKSPESGTPTSVSFVCTDTGQVAASYTSESCVVYDIETAKPIVTFSPEKTYGLSQINKVISHPTHPILITAHEDRHVRFFDLSSGKEVHSMVAHLDAVTSLSIDPSGLYILSGSHDGSIRLWSMENKTCIQEITAHRKKFDEAVFDVAFHPSQPYIASAGADALAKVFV
ncbi:striatin-3-like [Hydra vulgaris]|uniref:Calmodulin binding protein 3 n=1 Tax=Hydra vulgaris TaxID=6087 RepID=H6VZ32_HYDVU|nr:striatin-3-like [Hydra vulgaris]AFA36449.1 calmodulin binding protein 3 [Hydra vulgaris]